MARRKTELKAFNRGLVSRLGLARTDLERTGISAEVMTNWMPRNLGSMMLRPGTQYIGNSDSNNKARYIPFIYATDDTALIEMTDEKMRVWVNDALITWTSVATSVISGDFTSLTGWTDNDEGGTAESSLVGAQFLKLVGDGTNRAIRTQEVMVAAADKGVEHALEITIGAEGRGLGFATQNLGGPVTLRVGSTDGDDDYVAETQLEVGFHRLAFTPTDSFWVEFSVLTEVVAYVDTCEVASAGVMEMGTHIPEASLQDIRYDQSGDIVYGACKDLRRFKIERRSPRSWSIVRYRPLRGPLNPINTTPITISSNAVSGEATLTASQPLFNGIGEERVIRIDSDGQYVEELNINAGAADVWSSTIKVTGANDDRVFTLSIANRVDSTVTLQRSQTSETDGFNDVTTFVADTTTTYDDTLDNITAWYRIGVKTADYGTDAIDVTLDYPNGSITGYALIWATENDPKLASANIYQAFGGSSGTEFKNFYLGTWTEGNQPSTLTFDDGRLGWFGKNKATLSESDNYEGFDIDTIGDSGPITRTIGAGPVDQVSWALSLRRLLFGTDGREFTIRGSSEEEPLTPTNAALREFGTQGSANVLALKMDQSGLYVQRGGTRLREVSFGDSWEYGTQDLTAFNPKIGEPGITHIAIQRQPDNRVHCVRSDGTVAALLHDPTENVTCWLEIEGAAPNTKQYSYSNKSLDLSSFGSVGYRSIFSATGENMMYNEGGNDVIQDFVLGTEWEIDTATATGSLSLPNKDYDMAVANMGSSLYLLNRTDSQIEQYSLPAPYVAANGQDTGLTYSLGLGANTNGIAVKDDETRLWIAYSEVSTVYRIYQYDFGTPGDPSTLSLDTFVDITSDIGGININNSSLVVIDNQLYVTSSDEKVYLFILNSNHEITGMQYSGWTYDYSSEPTTGRGLAVRPDLSRFYVTDASTETMYQYDVTTSVAEIEDVVVLPGTEGGGEDAVYYSVKRTINGSTVRFLERWALESECEGGSQNKNLDAHVTGTVSGGTMAGLTHLEGESVSVWVDGVDAGKYPVISGQITGVTRNGAAVAGLPYMARFKSAKLGNLLDKKNLARLGVILDKTHYQGLKYGPDFDNLDDLPLVEDGVEQDENTIHDQYDEETFSFDGHWDTDSRLCLEAESPRPCTLLAAIIETEE